MRRHSESPKEGEGGKGNPLVAPSSDLYVVN
jgi:hypothetical protein